MDATKRVLVLLFILDVLQRMISSINTFTALATHDRKDCRLTQRVVSDQRVRKVSDGALERVDGRVGRRERVLRQDRVYRRGLVDRGPVRRRQAREARVRGRQSRRRRERG